MTQKRRKRKLAQLLFDNKCTPNRLQRNKSKKKQTTAVSSSEYRPAADVVQGIRAFNKSFFKTLILSSVEPLNAHYMLAGAPQQDALIEHSLNTSNDGPVNVVDPPQAATVDIDSVGVQRWFQPSIESSFTTLKQEVSSLLGDFISPILSHYSYPLSKASTSGSRQ